MDPALAVPPGGTMTEEPRRHSFWTTLPGVLTGIAALVTAVTGAIIGLSQLREKGSPNVPAGGPGPVTAAPASVESPSTPAASGDRMAVITARDGSVSSVYASSLRHHQTGRELPLLSGQSIPFDRIRTIDVTRLESDQARVDVTLVDGTVHSGALAAGLSPYGFAGVNELGSFEIRVDELSRISFEPLAP